MEKKLSNYRSLYWVNFPLLNSLKTYDNQYFPYNISVKTGGILLQYKKL